MYKPFVSCDDPKGVVECGSIRKRSLSCVPKRDERFGRGRPEPRSSWFSLMEISGETRKLSQLLDVWSKKKFRGSHSKEMADDIAESLAMIKKLQTSHQVSSSRDYDVAGGGSRRQGRNHRRKAEKMNEGTPVGLVSPLSGSTGPNLIARLMGIEEFPSKPMLPTAEKTLKPIFEIKTAGLRRSYDRPEQKTLDDVLETMRNVGLLASTSPVTYRSHHSSEGGYSGERLMDEGPPVVLIKPMPKGNSSPKLQAKVQECYAGTRARYGDQYLLERGIKFDIEDDSNGGELEIKSMDRILKSLSEKMDAEEREDEKLQSSYHMKAVNQLDQTSGKLTKLQAQSGSTNRREVHPGFVERKKMTFKMIEFDSHDEKVEEQSEKESRGHEIIIDNPVPKTENPLKILLMNSISFTTFVEEVFNGEVESHKLFPWIEEEDPKALEAKLVVDYAKEFVKRRTGRDEESLVPVSRLSFEQLVEEICSGVDSLIMQCHTADSLLDGNLDRDLRCNGGLSGTWEIGWRRGFSSIEYEQQVVHLQSLILHDLISELAR